LYAHTVCLRCPQGQGDIIGKICDIGILIEIAEFHDQENGHYDEYTDRDHKLHQSKA